MDSQINNQKENKNQDELDTSIFQSACNEELEELEEEYEEKETSEDQRSFIIQIICYLLNFLIFLFYIPFILIWNLLFGFFILISEGCQIDKLILLIQSIVCMASITYVVIMNFLFPSTNQLIQNMNEDGIYFIASALLVMSYLKTQIENVKSIFDMKDNFSILSLQIFYTLQYQSVYQDERFFSLGYYNLELNSGDTENKFISNSSKYFQKLQIKNQSPAFDYEMNEFFIEYNRHIQPNFKNFFYLSLVIIIKIFLVNLYIYKHSQDLSVKDIVEMSLIIFIYLYVAFNLNRVIGNSDFQKKINVLQTLNQHICFEDIKYMSDYSLKLDVTCPVSLECWDNARKILLKFKIYEFFELELVYFCLIFYYIFVLLICLSSFFELHWIFPKNSKVLNPINVIMSLFTFIFLNLFLLLRFKDGTKYNKALEELKSSVQQLSDVFSDLETMFQAFFIQNKIVEDQKSIYAVLVKKIKLQSKYLIENNEYFLEKTYNHAQKNILRKKIVKNLKKSFTKLQDSIDLDLKNYKYKFLNLIEINFYKSLFTVTITLISLLPNIIPKLKDFYSV